jgi:hypothetical protein
MEQLAKYKTLKQERMKNIENSLSNYSESIRAIGTLSAQSVKIGFTRYLEFLMSYNDAEKVQILNRVQKHFDAYQKNKRVDLNQWEQDIMF